MNKIVLAAIVSLSCVTFPAYADYSKRVCGGSDRANGCPVSKDIMLGCNPSEAQVGEAACSYWENGTRKVLPFHADHQGSHEGGSCGYEWYLVTCFTSGAPK